MPDDLLINLISNFPNFAGLVVLAYVLYSANRDMNERYDRLMDKYDDLVQALVNARLIATADARRLKERGEK